MTTTKKIIGVALALMSSGGLAVQQDHHIVGGILALCGASVLIVIAWGRIPRTTRGGGKWPG